MLHFDISQSARRTKQVIGSVSISLLTFLTNLPSVFATSPVACCLPSGNCVEVETESCAGMGGEASTFSLECLGNWANTSGRDDACVCNFTPAGAACAACPAEDCRPSTIRYDENGRYAEECTCAATVDCLPYWPYPFYSCEGTCSTTGEDCFPQPQFFSGGFELLITCECTPPCTSDVHCSDSNTCTYDCCVGDGFCNHALKKYGDATLNDVVNLDDVLCVLAGFSSFDLCPHADFGPGCDNDFIINLDDILAVLAAISGENPCGCGPTAGICK